jgi:hypothetical protein
MRNCRLDSSHADNTLDQQNSIVVNISEEVSSSRHEKVTSLNGSAHVILVQRCHLLLWSEMTPLH